MLEVSLVPVVIRSFICLKTISKVGINRSLVISMNLKKLFLEWCKILTKERAMN